MAISLTRLSGGNTPADGSDPRTFPAIWNASATAIETAIDEAGGGGGSITVSDTPPTDPAPENGNLWWDSVNGKLFVYYVDVDSSQWVDAAGPSVAVQSTAPTGYEGQLWLDDTDGSMYVYYTDPGGGASSWIGAVSRSGGILQVVSTTKTDTFSVSQVAGSSDAITGLTASITPRSTSSKILVTVAVSTAKASPYNPAIDITADGSVIASADSPGSRVPAMFVGAVTSDVSQAQTISGTSLHSPGTTSSVTYGVNLVNVRNATVLSYVNRSSDDTDSQARGRYVSTITLMEVAG